MDRVRTAQQADKLAAQGKIDAAIAQYELLVKDNPADVTTINKIGDLYSRLGRKPEAIHQFTKIGVQYAKDGFYLKAIAIYKKILKLDPSSIDAAHKLGDMHAQQGQVNEAKAQYTHVAEHYTRTGEIKKAIAVHQLLGKIEPGNLKARTQLVDLLQKDGRGAEAAEEMLGLAGELQSKGRRDEATAMLQKASNLGKGSRQFASRLASHQLKTGDADGAARTVTEALKGAADAPELLSLLGQAHMTGGRHDEAEMVLRRAAQIEPDKADHHLTLARTMDARGDKAGAASSLATRGEALKKAGKAAEALALLEEMGWRESKDRPLLRHVIDAMRALNAKDQGAGPMMRLLDLCLEAAAFDEATPLAEDLVRMLPGDTKLREKLTRARAASQKAEPPAKTTPAAQPVAPSAGPSAAATKKGKPPEPAAAPSSGRTATAGLAMHLDLPPALNLEPDDEDFITEHMTEADVFMKYGLTDRAIEQLATVVEKFPAYVPSHEKLREIHLEEGNRPAAIEQMDLLIRAHLAAGDQGAAEGMLDELKRFDPEYGLLAVLERTVRSGGASTGSPSTEDGEGDVAVEEDAPAANEPTREELDEVDFYSAQGMNQEASGMLHRLMQRYGRHPELVGRIEALEPPKKAQARPPAPAPPPAATARKAQPPARIEEDEFEIEIDDEPAAPEPARPAPPPARAAPAAPARAEVPRAEVPARAESAPPRKTAPSPPQPVEAPAAMGQQAAKVQQAGAAAGGSEDLLDLAAEIDSALSFPSDVADSAPPQAEAEPEGSSLREIVDAFKKGVEQQVAAEDVDTHYNLGIAYKEMGLLDEAIGEFQLAAKEPRLLVDCACMLGLCFKEKGMPALAVKWYRRGLEAAEDRDEETVLGLRYDLADILATQGEVKPALDLFSEVYGSNTKFRDVAQKLKELQSRASG